jgi:hypothetical protein
MAIAAKTSHAFWFEEVLGQSLPTSVTNGQSLGVDRGRDRDDEPRVLQRP